MKLNKIVITILGVIFTSLVSAGEDSKWRLAATLSAGPTWSSPSEAQTIYVQPEFPETFNAKSSTVVFGDGEFFFGLQHGLTSHLQSQLGFAVAGTTSIPIS